jgi:hypothetical protein
MVQFGIYLSPKALSSEMAPQFLLLCVDSARSHRPRSRGLDSQIYDRAPYRRAGKGPPLGASEDAGLPPDRGRRLHPSSALENVETQVNCHRLLLSCLRCAVPLAEEASK